MHEAYHNIVYPRQPQPTTSSPTRSD